MDFQAVLKRNGKKIQAGMLFFCLHEKNFYICGRKKKK